MKKYTRDDLQKDAERLMKAHKVDKLYATVDGSFFLKRSEGHTHNQELIKENKDDKDFDIIEFGNEETDEEEKAHTLADIRALSELEGKKDNEQKTGIEPLKNNADPLLDNEARGNQKGLQPEGSTDQTKGTGTDTGTENNNGNPQ